MMMSNNVCFDFQRVVSIMVGVSYGCYVLMRGGKIYITYLPEDSPLNYDIVVIHYEQVYLLPTYTI